LFSKGDQLKVKLAKLKFSEIGDGRLFLVFGGRLVIGRGDYLKHTPKRCRCVAYPMRIVVN